MKTKKILVEMPVDWEEQLSPMNDAWIGKTLYEMLGRSPVVEPCEDAISREDALMCMTGKYLADKEYAPEDIISNHIKRIKALPSVTPKQRWIPVSEGLPKEGKTVIASTKYGVYPEAKYTKEYGWEWAYEAGADYWVELENVTAWMPLPETYKPESEDSSCTDST